MFHELFLGESSALLSKFLSWVVVLANLTVKTKKVLLIQEWKLWAEVETSVSFFPPTAPLPISSLSDKTNESRHLNRDEGWAVGSVGCKLSGEITKSREFLCKRVAYYGLCGLP